VAELAEGAGLPTLQPERLRDEETLAWLRAREADVFLVASYGELLTEAVLEIPRLECLNVHPSLLPRHRGATPIPASILAGDEITGVSIQRMVLELDAGDVLVAMETSLEPTENAGELAARLAELSGEASVAALRALDEGTAEFVPQDGERATFCKKLTKEHGRIDWRHAAVELDRHVRAMTPWPGATTSLPGGQDLTVLRALPVERDAAEPGTILAVGKQLEVATGEGALRLVEVKPAGKRGMAAADFLRGARLEVGQLLGEAS